MPRLLTLPLTALLVVALAGCVPMKGVDVAPSRTPTVQATSDVQAFKVAVEVYVRLTAMGDLVARDGGFRADRLAEYTAGDFLEGSVEGLSRWPLKGWRQIGSSSVRNFSLLLYRKKPALGVVMDVCEDLTEVDVVDVTGKSVLSPDRKETFHFRAYLSYVEGAMKVVGRDLLDDQPC